jgi:glycosyltransferase involved in cell wall biosynthesis
MSAVRNNSGLNLNILVLEPFYGGSHQSFLTGFKSLPFTFDFLTLPARNWKWSMRLAAPLFAETLKNNGRRYDRIICSSYLDAAAFRGLAPSWTREVPLLTYFHENQFAYPVRRDDKRDVHFALTNMTTALASDSLAFNSHYNLNSFLDGMENILVHSTDIKLKNTREQIRSKSRIMAPGIDFSSIDSVEEPERRGTPVIVWNHRWEHDKNPELFFKTLFTLDDEGVDFKLIVLGQSFENSPSIFDEAKRKLSRKTLHFGYVEQEHDYAALLKRADIVISTALHEFFGISVMEAVRAGCTPLLPNRLSYPELFPDEYLYSEEYFLERIIQELSHNKRLPEDRAMNMTEPYSWEFLKREYASWIMNTKIDGTAS